MNSLLATELILHKETAIFPILVRCALPERVVMGPNWFIRMYGWARNPPSLEKVRLVLLVVLACFALWGIEHMGLWPDWLTVNPPAKP
jgi:hypothetical protein